MADQNAAQCAETRAADAELELEQIVQACEEEDPTQYESEEGIKLFFRRLYDGWHVNAAGRLVPPQSDGPDVPVSGAGTMEP